MRAGGYDGCNTFSGSIIGVDIESIKLGPLATTQKACKDMNLPVQFHQYLNNVESYSVQKQLLILSDGQGQELFVFRKTD